MTAIHNKISVKHQDFQMYRPKLNKYFIYNSFYVKFLHLL